MRKEGVNLPIIDTWVANAIGLCQCKGLLCYGVQARETVPCNTLNFVTQYAMLEITPAALSDRRFQINGRL